MLAEGTLSIRLSVARGAVEDVAITSTRPVHAADALSRRSPADVQRLVPLLFPVCGVAHGVAFARAIERALGREPPPRLDAARDVACLAEAAVSHVWQLAIGWPGAAGAPSDPARVRQARRVAEQLYLALFGAPGLGAGSRQPVVEGRAGGRAVPDHSGARARRGGRRAPGRGEPRGARKLRSHRDPGGRAARLDGGRGAPFGRPGVRRARRNPRSPGRRERVRTPPRLRECPRGRSEARPRPPRPPRRAASRRPRRRGASRCERRRAREDTSHGPESGPSRGEGVGCATTARGPIHYWVRADEQWSPSCAASRRRTGRFTRRGSSGTPLVGAPSSPTLGRDAGWLVLALDPCVPWSVEVQDA